ncbi:MAG: hypothetical protein RLZZ293_1526 [Pseudomonadota bacterium]|jgi:PTS system D-glucosamine-specific IIC component
MKKFFAVLQQVGQSLMLPVALLPAAGILLAIGNALQNPALIHYLPFLDASWLQALAHYMEQSGGIVFANLPILFCVGVAVGLSGGEGVAALAALVGFLIMNVVVGLASHVPDVISQLQHPDPKLAIVLGIPTLQMGVFGGIIMGILAAKIYKKYYDIELPPYLAFFAGKRFVPIMTAVVAIIIGLLLCVIWPHIGNFLQWFSSSMIDANLTLSAFIFGVIERSLIPFGLHHIFYNPFWYQFGDYVSKSGQIVHGDQAIFFAQLKDGVPFTAGTFMTGKFPFMMFGLPAAAYAMYKEAAPEKRKVVGALMFSAALTAFLTGITEPIEFSFLFVAPMLFAVHAIFAGLSFMIMQLLGVHIGMTFSGGFIDFILFGLLPNRTPWWWVIIIGMGVFMPLYYFGFRFIIRKFDLATPGREKEQSTENNQNDSVVPDSDGYQHAYQVLTAFGGIENIATLNACMSRLRIEVKDKTKVNKAQLKQLGAAGVLEVGNSVQAVYGTRAEIIKTKMAEIRDGKVTISQAKPPITNNTTTFESSTSNIEPKSEDKSPQPSIKSNLTSEFVMPLAGEIIPLSEVPDEVFSQKIMGDGFAIRPTGNLLVSPVVGKVTMLFKTNHACIITRNDGVEILLHIGIDTVNLGGHGFERLVKEGEQVIQGTPLIRFTPETIAPKVPSLITPIIFTNLNDLAKELTINDQGSYELGDAINIKC